MTSQSTGARWWSGCEFLLGAGIVIGHNLLHVVPNEVPILFVLGLVSFRLRNGGWAAMGLRRPDSWRRVLLLAAAAALARILLGDLVVLPIAETFWPPPVDPKLADEITGNLAMAFLALVIVWTFAAFGEEVGYRGYLVTRAADVGRGSNPAYWAGVAVVAVLFGVGHAYKGPAGMLDSGIAGLILGAAFLLSGRILWTSILAHGFIDTAGVVAAYFGWD